MRLGAKDYYQAGQERMRQAERLYEEGTSYALAMYCGGLAVECLLRAFRWKEDATFEGRHDLSELLRASRLLRIDDEFMRRRGESEEAIGEAGRRLRAAMNEVAALWSNNHRFASEAKLKGFLKDTGRLQRGKGDPLKKNALDLINAARTVVDRGVALWVSEKKS